MTKNKREIPEFKNEDEERDFWATHSPLDYFNSKRFGRGSFPNLKPSLKSISIRLPEDLLVELKTLANKRDVPYQSLVKIFLARQIILERESLRQVTIDLLEKKHKKGYQRYSAGKTDFNVGESEQKWGDDRDSKPDK
jgi:predicted DNA binding CopG/RHH family protein